MPRAARTCTDCPAIITVGTRCTDCTNARRRATPQAPRDAEMIRGYNSRGHKAFRLSVIARDPICVLCNATWATVADHYPQSRKQRIELGLDPDDPTNGRGLCAPCHNRETARLQPGGWNISRTV